eukprot:COSAG02_NODE_1237_length_13725_cov_27.071921_14_plen_557_part_00
MHASARAPAAAARGRLTHARTRLLLALFTQSERASTRSEALDRELLLHSQQTDRPSRGDKNIEFVSRHERAGAARHAQISYRPQLARECVAGLLPVPQMAELWSFAAGAAAATAVGCCAGTGALKTARNRALAQGSRVSDDEMFELFDRFEDAVRHRFPRRVILVRHGESEGNVDLDIYRTKPDAALRLTPKGKAQAVEAGKKLRADIGDSKVHFIVSPYTRTRETLHGILQAFDDPSQINAIVEDPRIREQEFGMYQVRSWPAVVSLSRPAIKFTVLPAQDPEKMPEIMRERRQIGSFYYRFPDGESGADVYDRVDNFVEHLHRMFRRPPKRRGSSRRAHVVSRSDRHGRTRPEVDNSPSLSPPVDSPSAESSKTNLPSLKRLESRLFSVSSSIEGNEEGADVNDTIVIVTHGLTARLFLMRWFHLTVDQFHSLYNMGNCERYNLELRCGSSDGRARYMITHPLRAGGQFPPPHTNVFTGGISSVEPCTWGITLDEAAWIWDKYDVTSPRAGHDEHGGIGKIKRFKRTRSVSPCPCPCGRYSCETSLQTTGLLYG